MKKKSAKPVGFTWSRHTPLHSACSRFLRYLMRAQGSYTLAPSNYAAVPAGTSAAIFVLALVGFGFKAGIMPLPCLASECSRGGAVPCVGLHVGRPDQDGHLRTSSCDVIDSVIRRCTSVSFSSAFGVVSGVSGVAFAIGQHDLKRLLAYHSIENIGIIVMGIGLAMIGRSLGRADWIVLGLGGSLLHVWNHALFKAPPLPERRLRHPLRSYPRDRPAGGPGEDDAVDFRVFSGRVGRHLRPAASEWLRQRVPHLSRACSGPSLIATGPRTRARPSPLRPWH